MKDDNNLTVIIPVHNEEKNLPILYQKLSTKVPKLATNYEYIFIDDGSTDNGLIFLKNIAQQDKHVKLIEFARNYGQTAAFAVGINHASGEIVVLIDADLQNNPEDIKKLIDEINQGFDVVSGWRKNRHDSLITRKIPSYIANKIISKVTGVKLNDYGCTLKAYRSNIIKNINLYGEMHRFIPAYAAMQGAKVTEVIVSHHQRKFGKSHYGLTRTVKVILDLLTLQFLSGFATKPIYFFGISGLILAFLGVVMILFVIFRVVFLAGEWISPMILLSILFLILGFQFLLMGLLAEILIRTYFESQNKKPYTIKNTTNL